MELCLTDMACTEFFGGETNKSVHSPWGHFGTFDFVGRIVVASAVEVVIQTATVHEIGAAFADQYTASSVV